MNKNKLIEMVWSLYQARLKYSTEEKDFEKLQEEQHELYRALLCDCRQLDDEVMSETADNIIIALGMMCWTYQPESYMELELMFDNLFEWIEEKTERTIERFEKGFYKCKTTK